jgi:thiol-disulfide isomerase/thioredoxin
LEACSPPCTFVLETDRQIMRKSSLPRLLLLSALLVAGCALQPDPEPGKPAADFSATLLDGKPVSLSALRGKVIVLDFWATWCAPCREGLPHLQAMSADPGFSKSGLEVLAINEAEDDDTVRSFLAANHYTFPTVRDGDGSIGRTFEVSVLPTTIVVGRDGNVRAVCAGLTTQTTATIRDPHGLPTPGGAAAHPSGAAGGLMGRAVSLAPEPRATGSLPDGGVRPGGLPRVGPTTAGGNAVAALVKSDRRG